MPPPPGREGRELRFTIMKPTQNKVELMMVPRGLQTAESVFQVLGGGLMEVLEREPEWSLHCTVRAEGTED